MKLLVTDNPKITNRQTAHRVNYAYDLFGVFFITYEIMRGDKIIGEWKVYQKEPDNET